MTNEMLEKICEILPDLFQKNSHLFSSSKNKDWYQSRHEFLINNEKMLKIILDKMREEYNCDLATEELFLMQKLFLMYPDCPPKKLLSMSWEVIQIILKLCDVEKRKFYTDIAYYLDLDSNTLSSYILNDLYEKVVYLISEIQDYNIVNSDDFIEKVLDIQMMVWE